MGLNFPTMPKPPKLPKPPTKRGLVGSSQRFGTQLGMYGKLAMPKLPTFAAMDWNNQKTSTKRPKAGPR